jgi:hypothetical protein
LGVMTIRTSSVPSMAPRLWTYWECNVAEARLHCPLRRKPPSSGTAMPGRVPWSAAVVPAPGAAARRAASGGVRQVQGVDDHRQVSPGQRGELGRGRLAADRDQRSPFGADQVADSGGSAAGHDRRAGGDDGRDRHGSGLDHALNDRGGVNAQIRATPTSTAAEAAAHARRGESRTRRAGRSGAG